MIKECPSCKAACFICQSTEHVAKDCQLRKKKKKKSQTQAQPAQTNGAEEAPTDSIAGSAKKPNRDADHKSQSRPKLRTKPVPRPPPSSQPLAEPSSSANNGNNGNKRREVVMGAKQTDGPTNKGQIHKPRPITQASTDRSEVSGEDRGMVSSPIRIAGDCSTKPPTQRNKKPEAGNSGLRPQKRAPSLQSHQAPPSQHIATAIGGESDSNHPDVPTNALMDEPSKSAGAKRAKPPRKRRNRKAHAAIDAIAAGRGIEGDGASRIVETALARPCGGGKVEPVVPRSASAGERRTEKRRERRRTQRRRDEASLSTSLSNLRISTGEADSAVGRADSSSPPEEV